MAIGGFAVIIDIFFLVNLNLGSYILGFVIFSGSVERHVKLHSLQIYISHSLPSGDETSKSAFFESHLGQIIICPPVFALASLSFASTHRCFAGFLSCVHLD